MNPPAGHRSHDLALSPIAVNSPAGHARQADLPAVGEYVSAGHEEQAVAFGPAANCPGSQVSHPRPSTSREICPGGQARHALAVSETV